MAAKEEQGKQGVVLYHAAWCRSLRVLWLLEELEHPYTLVTKKYDPADLQTPEYLKLHPLGQVPVVVDDEVTIWESGAIMTYLLDVYGLGSLRPGAHTPEWPTYLQFFHFGESIMTPIHEIIAHTADLPEAERLPQVAEAAKKGLVKSLAVVEQQLTVKGPFICGADFNAADISLGYSLALVKHYMDLLSPEKYPKVLAYLKGLEARPAYQRAFVGEHNVE